MYGIVITLYLCTIKFTIHVLMNASNRLDNNFNLKVVQSKG